MRVCCHKNSAKAITQLSSTNEQFIADTGTLWSCIRYADVTLYRAKNVGCSRCVQFTKDMWTEDQV